MAVHYPWHNPSTRPGPRIHTPDGQGVEGAAHPGEVLVAVPDGLGEGRVIGEQRLGTGAGVGEEVLLVGHGSRLLQQQTRDICRTTGEPGKSRRSTSADHN